MLTSPNKSNFSIQTTGVHVHHSSLVQSPIEPSTDIVTFINGEGILTYITPSITPVLGYAPEECINQPLLTLVHTDDLDTTQNLLKKVGEEPAHGLYTEHRLRHKDGSWRWFEFHGTNLLQVAGVGSIVGVFHDITEQKSTLSLEEGREGSAEHIIQFYKDDTFLLDVLSEFIDTGLRAGDACIVVGTPIHRAELETRLHTNGLELTSARLQDRYIALDADELLSQFMVGEMPDPKRFSEIISAVLARAEKGQRRVRIFGEMVDRLWKEGKRAAAIYLEDLWNHLNTPPTRPFTLFCAYSIHNFDGEAHELSFSHICRQHSRVQPDESYISLTNSNERLRNIAALQQKANSLEAETAAHRQTKVALQEAGARFRFLAETMPQKICTAKPNGDVDYFNPQWAEFTGLPLDEISGWNWQQFIHPEDVEKTVTHWQHSLVTGEPFYFEHRFRRADGVYRWHVSRAIPVYDDGGNIYMWIASNTDIDEQKRLEERKDEFISMASHELKTPVTSLKGFTQILQKRLKSQVDPQTLLFLERMEAQIEKLASLISDLLDVSKMQKGILTFRESNFDFDEMIRETIENVQASTKTHHLSLQGETHASVFGDRNRLGQVLINLLTNAIKYSPQSNDIIVRLNKHDEQVEVAVQDFGLGIDKAYHAHIFDRFYQVPGLQEKTYSGLGIGLYISHTIIERHGGRLWLESQKGAGSTFYFTVPSLRRTQEISHLQREEK